MSRPPDTRGTEWIIGNYGYSNDQWTVRAPTNNTRPRQTNPFAGFNMETVDRFMEQGDAQNRNERRNLPQPILHAINTTTVGTRNTPVSRCTGSNAVSSRPTNTVVSALAPPLNAVTSSYGSLAPAFSISRSSRESNPHQGFSRDTTHQWRSNVLRPQSNQSVNPYTTSRDLRRRNPGTDNDSRNSFREMHDVEQLISLFGGMGQTQPNQSSYNNASRSVTRATDATLSVTQPLNVISSYYSNPWRNSPETPTASSSSPQHRRSPVVNDPYAGFNTQLYNLSPRTASQTRTTPTSQPEATLTQPVRRISDSAEVYVPSSLQNDSNSSTPRHSSSSINNRMNESNQTQQHRNANQSIRASGREMEQNNARNQNRGPSPPPPRPPPPRRVVDPYAGFMPQTVEDFTNLTTRSNTPSAPAVPEDVTDLDHRAILDLPPSYDEVVAMGLVPVKTTSTPSTPPPAYSSVTSMRPFTSLRNSHYE